MKVRVPDGSLQISVTHFRRGSSPVWRSWILLGVLAMGLPCSAPGVHAQERSEHSPLPRQFEAPNVGQIQAESVKPVSTAVVNFTELARESEKTALPAGQYRGVVAIHDQEIGDEIDPPAPYAPGPEANAPSAPSMIEAGSPLPVTNYEGMPDTPANSLIFIPPDTQGAIGTDATNRIFSTCNNNYRVQNKTTGATISTTPMETFWASTGATGLFDPRTLYDPYNNRWIVSAVSNGQSAASSILIGVSQTSDPGGAYFLFRFDSDSANTRWADFPMVGFNTNWVAVSVNMFVTASGAFAEGRTLVLNYGSLRAGTASATYFTGIGLFCLHPAITYSSTQTTLYMVSLFNSATATYVVAEITGTPSTPSIAAPGGVQTRTGGAWLSAGGNIMPQAPEPPPGAGTQFLEAQDAFIRSNPVFRNNSIYFVQTVGLPLAGLTHTAVQWTRVNTAGVFQEGGRIEDPAATNANGLPWYAFPSIAVNSMDDVLIGFSRFKSDDWVSAAYTYKDHTDPAGTTRIPYNFKLGEDFYFRDFGSGRNRWGDYSSTLVDPTDDLTMWTMQQYAETNIYGPGQNGTWGTWWARVRFSLTEADFDSFEATSYPNGQFLQWKTGREVDNLGFNIYREENGARMRVNPDLLAGSALRGGVGVEIKAGESYVWWDRQGATANTRYWLETVDLSGHAVAYGPFSVTAGVGPPPRAEEAKLLSAMAGAFGGVTLPVERTAALPSAKPPVFKGAATGPALKLGIGKEGWYRLDAAQLANTGVGRVDPRFLHLFVDGIEQPLSIRGEDDGSLDPGDAVEFYATGVASPYSDLRTYHLTVGASVGKRIKSSQFVGAPSSAAAFAFAVERKDRLIYVSSLRNGEEENFFGAPIASQPLTQTLSIDNLQPAASQTSIVDVAIQGLTLVPHAVAVELNGNLLGTISFDGQQKGTARYTIPTSLLASGVNEVRFTRHGGATDISLVDSVRITYPRALAATNNALRYVAPGSQQTAVTGFTSPDVRVFDVTDPNSVVELRATVQGGSGGYTAAATPVGRGNRVMLALTADQASHPASVDVDRPSNLRQSTNGADLIIVTTRALAPSVEPLRQRRQSQGYAASVVDVDDIYDEFSFGQKTPYAIRSFLQYARTSWSRPPRFVLFAGDASYDPKGFLGFGAFDLVPTRLIDTKAMETASDDWLADFDRDGVADLAVGRFPARTPEALSHFVSRTLQYENASSSRSFVAASDVDDTFNFTETSESILNTLPPGYTTHQIERGALDPDTARKQLLSAINEGQTFVHYAGHGSVTLWRGSFLTIGDVSGLTNTNRLHVFVGMTCLNGYFHDPLQPCLAEGMLAAPDGGAVAAWVSSGITFPDGQSDIDREFFRLVFGKAGTVALTLGEAAMRAKAATQDADVRATWIFLGDPTLRLGN